MIKYTVCPNCGYKPSAGFQQDVDAIYCAKCAKSLVIAGLSKNVNDMVSLLDAMSAGVNDSLDRFARCVSELGGLGMTKSQSTRMQMAISTVGTGLDTINLIISEVEEEVEARDE